MPTTTYPELKTALLARSLDALTAMARKSD
jgi:hypothetical protein